jgi:Tfp pilus assembly protein PilF
MATISAAYAAAVGHLQAGDTQRAEAICSQINIAAPDYSDAWYFRGLIHYSLGDRKRAI